MTTMEVAAPRRFIVTPAIAAMSIASFLAMVSLGVSPMQPSAADVLPFGANFGALTVQGEWWRLLASVFVHYGALHLLMNMWCLWILGGITERLFGNARFLAVYLLSGLGGSMASLLWHPYVVSAGASGAVFGLAGALGAFVYLGRVNLPARAVRELLTSIGFFVGANLIIGFSFSGIDNAGHLGGLVTGALLGAAAAGRAFYPSAAIALVALVGLAPLAKRMADENPEVMVSQALMDLESGEAPTAIEQLQRAVTAKPDFVRGYEALATLYADQGRHPDAIEAARRAVELDPQSEIAQHVLARSLYFNGQYDAAVDELRIAAQMTPEDVFTRAILARSLGELERHLEAIAALDEALTWEPDSSFLHQEKGLLLYEAGETEAAVASLREAIALDPEGSEGYNRLSLVLARSGAHDEALEAVKTALEMSPDAPHILDSLGTVHFHRREFALSAEAYRKAIAAEPERAVYHYNLSLALDGSGDVEAADAARAEALRLDPSFVPSEDGLPLI